MCPQKYPHAGEKCRSAWRFLRGRELANQQLTESGAFKARGRSASQQRCLRGHYRIDTFQVIFVKKSYPLLQGSNL